KLGSLELSDSYTVTLLEAVGARDNRARINDVFQIIKDHPTRYPRAMARFLSTYHGAPAIPGTVDRWVKSHGREIDENVVLWGGVGAWMVAKSNWRGAVNHLTHWQHRAGVKPWMLHLLGRAHEALGQPAEAMNAYRAALSLETDHTEATIRSKLAFQMALEGMAGAGRLILLDLSEEAKKLGTVEDLMRTFSVQAFADAETITSAQERAQILQESFQQLRQLARQDPYCNPRPILRAFRERSDQLIQLARFRESPPEPTEL
ncbi:MAG: tetratricopeptide repeat protein, partial [Candidatus Sumerlaeia bacterium]|nr:tetratricopeptide repeat protein [Candidatus Sumerlaeia bacterium]